MDGSLWILGAVGHLGIWCLIFNRIHATAWPRSRRKLSEKAILLAVVVPVAWIVIRMIGRRTLECQLVLDSGLAWSYLNVCVVMGVLFVARWAWLKFVFKLPESVVGRDIETIDVRARIQEPLLHGSFANFLGRIPRNEILKLTLERMTLELDIPTDLDGLKICQLSDLHFTGQIGIEYFQKVIEEANRFEPDLVFITGDLVDEVDCLEWLEETLGRLKAKWGVFYVLGNHDLRIEDAASYRESLAKLGLRQASGVWSTIEVGNTTIKLTGNELPWYQDADSLAEETGGETGLRILLSHSPDQLDWARKYNFDLMFAGHTHGGQIAFPIIGPVIAPSKYGVRYAGGTYQIGEMLMHVSRGISGDEPIRFCSPPELGLFTIRSSRQPCTSESSTSSR